MRNTYPPLKYAPILQRRRMGVFDMLSVLLYKNGINLKKLITFFANGRMRAFYTRCSNI